MIDRIKKIKKHRIDFIYKKLLLSVNIHDNHDKYIKYIKNHYNYEKNNNIGINDSTLSDAVVILSFIDMNRIDILNENKYPIEHKVTLRINYNFSKNYFSIHRQEIISIIRKLLEKHNKLSIIKLFTKNKKDNTIESIFYTN